MRVINLQASNFKRLVAVDVTPDGSTVIVAGKNGAGKSSILDAIWATLAGRKGSKELTQPIRAGETKASVQVTLDDIVVTRRWSASGSSLEVTGRDGTTKFAKPQQVLDKLIGDLSFDPLAFAEAKPADQRAMLLAQADLDVDPDVLDARRKEAYDERTFVNREVKSAKARLDSMMDPPDGTPDEPPSVRDIAARLEAVIQEQATKRRLLEDHAEAGSEIAELEQRIESIKTRRTEIVARGKALDADLLSADPEAIRAELAGAQDVVDAVALKRERKVISTTLLDAENQSAELTAKIDAIDAEKAEALGKAALPVEGLGFDADGVLYNGVPFAQASAAERLRVSVAMAMALNPELRVITVRDASLLDDEMMAVLSAACDEGDYQLWLERVGDDERATVVIEDGKVKD